MQCRKSTLQRIEQQQEPTRWSLIKLYDGTLAEKINSADIFRFVPNHNKSNVHRWKGPRQRTRRKFNTNRVWECFVCRCVFSQSLHSLVQKCPMTYTSSKPKNLELDLEFWWFLGVADHQMTSPLDRFVFLTIIRFKFLFNLYKSSFRQTNAKFRWFLGTDKFTDNFWLN